VLGLLHPVGLAPAMTLLDVAAGLGGPARAVAAALGIAVTGLERDYELAEAGMAMALAAGLARRAPVRVFDPESFDLPERQFDAVLGREATYAVRDKERFLRVVMQALKPQGALVLTEFVLDRDAGDPRQLAAWAPLADHPPELWTLARYEDCLKSQGFELRLARNISAAYRAMILAGWTRLARRAELPTLARAHFLTIIDEAERAMRTLSALDSGILKMFHIVAATR
jgi:cyclopropane fatty-acyl-phospholipid synthase-like methyltransferase